MSNRTDLALESYESKEATRLDGVSVTENDNLTTVEVLTQNGANKIGKFWFVEKDKLKNYFTGGEEE